MFAEEPALLLPADERASRAMGLVAQPERWHDDCVQRAKKRARRSLIDILLVVAIGRNTWAGLDPDIAQIIVLHTIATKNASSAFEKVPGETRERHGQDNVKRGTIAYCR
jgi:hypothetical protein